MVKSEIAYKGRAVESLQNFETVKYFAAESHELNEYSGFIKVWQGNKVRSERTLAALNACQKIVICLGVTAVMYVSVAMVAQGVSRTTVFVCARACTANEASAGGAHRCAGGS
jgi:ABC-type transport system involved in Fe-S cluster assembly fused permease/ATPase subunit